MDNSKCACVSADAKRCIAIRYNIHPDDDEYDQERCECACHYWEPEEDYDF